MGQHSYCRDDDERPPGHRFASNLQAISWCPTVLTKQYTSPKTLAAIITAVSMDARLPNLAQVAHPCGYSTGRCQHRHRWDEAVSAPKRDASCKSLLTTHHHRIARPLAHAACGTGEVTRPCCVTSTSTSNYCIGVQSRLQIGRMSRTRRTSARRDLKRGAWRSCLH